MGKIVETKITEFGSIALNPRKKSDRDFAFACHFNIFRSGKLSPNVAYTTFTDGDEKVVKFLYAKRLSGATVVYNVYGLGDDGAGKPKIFRDPGQISLSPSWEAVETGTTGAKAANVFFEYKNYLYGWQAGTSLWQVGDISSDETPAITQAYQSITYTNVAQPVHHKADDIAYFFSDNLVHKLNDTSWTSSVLTLPSNMKIIGGAAYGNYLAIVCSPKELGTTNSVMYLWDRDSGLSTLTAKIDLGMGETVHVSEAEDGGIWLTQQTQRTAGVTSKNNSISIKYYNGYLETLDIPVGMPSDYFQSIVLVGNAWEEKNVFYFPATIVTTGAAETRYVIFAARRKNGRIELTADQEITGGAINGIYSIGGIWYVSHSTDAQSMMAKVTSDFQTGTYESQIFSTGDPSVKKKLIGLSVFTSPLPSSATVTLKYRIDAEIAWTTIFTYETITAGSFTVGKAYQILLVGTTNFTLIGATSNTVGLVFVATGAGTGTGIAVEDANSHSAINIESTGATLPEYKEIQFRIESTVGAEITGYSFMEEIIGKRLYMSIWEAFVNFGKSLFAK